MNWKPIFGWGRAVAASAAAAFLLSACASSPKPGPSYVAPERLQASRTTLADARLARAIELLNRGDPARARRELEALDRQTVNNRAVDELLVSLDADPVQALGKDHFSYETQAGDTMASIAGRFLHDPMKFYLLARYNGVATPADLAPGQTLMIPRPAIRRAAPRQAYLAPQARAAAPHPPPTPPEAIHAAAAPPPAVDARKARLLRSTALEDLDRGQVRRAVALLEAASTSDPDDPAIRRDLARARRIQSTVDAR